MKFVEDLKTEYYEMEHLGQEKFRELNDKLEVFTPFLTFF